MPVVAHAADPFYAGVKSDGGWHFYNEEKEQKKKKPLQKEKKKLAVKKEEPRVEKEKAQPVYTGPAPLSAAWLKVNLPKYLDAAIDDPTPTKVKAYLLLQKLSLDKSSKFSEVAQSVSLTDPLLDEVTRRPLATSGTHIAASIASAKLKRLFKRMSKDMGLWVFYQGNCPYCNLIGELINAYHRLYGFSVTPISLDGTKPPASFPLDNGYKLDAGQSRVMKIMASPAIYLVNAKEKDYISVVQGSSISMPEMEQRILLAALQKKWITEDDYRGAQPANNVPFLTSAGVSRQTIDHDGFIDQQTVVKFMEGGR